MSIETDCIMEVDTSAWPSSYYGKGKRVDLEKFFEKVQQEQKEIEQRQLEDLVRKQSQRKETGNGRTGLRQVRFSPDPPTVFEYEAEYDTFDRLVSSIEQSKDIWPSHARRPPHRLDLRPIRNHQYGSPAPTCITTTTSSPTPPITTTSPLGTTATFLPQRSASTSSATRSSPLSFVTTTRSSSLPTTTTITGSPLTLLSTPPLSPSPHRSPQDDSSDDDDQPSPIAPLTPTNSLPFSPTTLTRKLTAVFTRKKRS